jgi:Type II secretion system protein C
MPTRIARHLVSLNALLLVVAAFLILHIVRTLTAPLPPEPASNPAAVRVPGGSAGQSPGAERPRQSADRAEPSPRPPLAPYTSIAEKNLFSPKRTESSSVQPAAAPAPPPPPKLFLQGVVVTEDLSIAYLEDASTKRTFGYRVGDSVAGRTVQSISMDRVTLEGPGGRMEVKLHDPAKPRAPVQPSSKPGAPGAAGTPAPSAPPAAQSGPSVQPPAGQPAAPTPLSPGLRRPPPDVHPPATSPEPVAPPR